MSSPSDSSNSSGFELSDDGFNGFTRHQIGRSKCRTCPEINSIKTILREENRTRLTRQKYHRMRQNASKISESSNKNFRHTRLTPFLHFRKRQRNNDSVHFIATRKTIKLMMVNKSSQTTELSSSSSSSSSSSFEKDTTRLECPVWLARHCENVETNPVPSDPIGPIASTRSLPSKDRNHSVDPTKKPVPTKPINTPNIPKILSSKKKNDYFFSATKKGLSMSDSILAIPKYDCPRSLTILRPRRPRHEAERSEKDAENSRCRRFTSNHRIKNLGNEVHQILTRKRSAKVALENLTVLPDSKRKYDDADAKVEFLLQPKHSEIINSGDVIDTNISGERSINISEPPVPTNDKNTQQIPSIHDHEKSQPHIPFDCLSPSESQESIQIIEIRKGNLTSVSDKNSIPKEDTTIGSFSCSNINYAVDGKMVTVKKERPYVIDQEQIHSSRAVNETRLEGGPRNISSPSSDDNDDYHFLMSLHCQLKNMPLSKKLKMRLRIQTMFYEDMEFAGDFVQSSGFL